MAYLVHYWRVGATVATLWCPSYARAKEAARGKRVEGFSTVVEVAA